MRTLAIRSYLTVVLTSVVLFGPGCAGEVGAPQGECDVDTVQTALTTSEETDVSVGNGKKRVTICHVPPGNPENRNTITVSESALPAHLAHGDTLGACSSASVSTFASYINPDDPLILAENTAEGRLIEYFGQKDSEGFATSIDHIRVTDSEGNRTEFTLDLEGRPTRLFAFNGVVFDITWQSDTLILISAISADGSIQANVSVDLESLTAVPISTATISETATHMQLKSNTAPRAGTHALATSTELHMATKAVSLDALLYESATSRSLIDVIRCSDPVDNALVTMLVATEPGSSTPSFTVPASFLGNGTYEARIPTIPSDIGDRAAEICESIAGPLGNVCTALSLIPAGTEPLICSAIAAAIDLALGGPTGEGVAIMSACTSAFGSARAYCATVGESGLPGAPSLADYICDNMDEIVDRFTGEDYLLEPTAYILGAGHFFADEKFAPAEGPFPNFVIDAGGEADIVSFTSSPVDPAPYQSYVATADIACAPPNTGVLMRIVGTDGYTDSATCSISGNSSCSLWVPGAEDGVIDRVTTSIDGGPSRQIVLVF